VVLDNGRYGETGMQASHTDWGVDLAEIARGCGFADARVVTDSEGVADLAHRIHDRSGPTLSAIKILPEKLPLFLPPRDGALLKDRFRRALLGVSQETG
jgi:thiamine pyrophosphate-dependent acetolactate synthase large subunit-like protein